MEKMEPPSYKLPPYPYPQSPPSMPPPPRKCKFIKKN